jgi:hypothetical protein
MLAGKVLGMYTLATPVGTMKHDWQTIWFIPGVGATAVMVIFLIFFRNPSPAVAKSHADDVIAGRAEENLELP